MTIDRCAPFDNECGTHHLRRRTLLKAAGLSGVSWLSPVAEVLARDAERSPRQRPRSVILLWLAGGPSQLETFDPHPGTNIAAESKAIDTRVSGIQLSQGLEQLADQMDVVSLVRNVVSQEGDHERAVYNIKTGFRPDPTLVHPAIGAVICHQLPVGNAEIPRHVSILPGRQFGRGGYLGEQYDAFQINEPGGTVPDVEPRVDDKRFAQRLHDLDFLDTEFELGRLKPLEHQRVVQKTTIGKALRMMDSKQLRAFDIAQEPQSLQADFGATPFGRGCLAALRLIEVGVRCIEITLGGWDSHVNNHGVHDELKRTLDPAFASLLRELRKRELLDKTIVLCGGEFGRTPSVNLAGGRDHWPHGFSVALAGGSIRAGYVHGMTDPFGSRIPFAKGTPIQDIHATILAALGIPIETMLDTPVGRPMAISEGSVIRKLLA